MDNKNTRKILLFIDGIGGINRQEMVHGTLYLKLDNDRDCDFIHTEIRKFYKEFVNPEGGVNMYAVGDEFAFDFVPQDREAPVFCDEDPNVNVPGREYDADDKGEAINGVWSEFAEEEMLANVDTMIDLENDAKEGR